METHAPVAHVGFGHQVHLFKQFKGAVDGRDVEAGVALAYILVDLLALMWPLAPSMASSIINRWGVMRQPFCESRETMSLT